MPRYEFRCERCKKPFELIVTISEREKSMQKCPK
jgi:putative FmdB family regulatory protein